MIKTKTLLIILIIFAVAEVILATVSCPFKKPKPEEPVIAENIRGFSGEIKEISGQTFLIEAKILLADPEKEPITKIVKVLVADNTKISKLEFPKEIPAGSTKPVFPKETEISFNDLKLGNKIDVVAGEDISGKIKNNEEILASIINIAE